MKSRENLLANESINSDEDLIIWDSVTLTRAGCTKVLGSLTVLRGVALYWLMATLTVLCGLLWHWPMLTVLCGARWWWPILVVKVCFI